MLSAIIVAAGSSQRMGLDKLFALLGGRPVVAHTLAAFERTDCVDEIILVGRAERLGELQQLVRFMEANKSDTSLPAARNGRIPSAPALNSSRSEGRYVAVHDAARPLITPNQIERVFEVAQQHGAAALAEAITDTLKRADKDGVICGGVDREGLYAMQTPQIFSRDLLLEAYDAVAASKLSITDEVSAVEHLGRKVVLVPNEEINFKITSARDLKLAEFVIQQRAAKE